MASGRAGMCKRKGLGNKLAERLALAGGQVLGAREVLQKAKDSLAMQAQRVLDGCYSCI